MISFDPHKPIVLVLTGKSGVGKSTLAGAIAPPLGSSTINYTDNLPNPWNRHPIHWHEFSIQPPLQALLAARSRIEGENDVERQKYEILKTLLDLFNQSPLYGAPPFDDLVRMVNELMSFSANYDKSFMRSARQLIEAYDPDALYKCLSRSVIGRYVSYNNDLVKDIEELEDTYPDKAFGPKLFGAVISDVSSDEEWDFIRSTFDNTLVIELQCDEDIRMERLDDHDTEVWRVPLSEDSMLFLDTGTKVERMVLNGDPLPITDDDNRRGKSKGKQRCIDRLKAEEFEELLTRFRSIFQTESVTNAQDQ